MNYVWCPRNSCVWCPRNSCIAAASEILEQRASTVDPDELAALQRILRMRSEEWQRWQRLRWSGALHAEDTPLMRPAGAYVPSDRARVSWATPQSLRNLDAECQVWSTIAQIDRASTYRWN